MDNCSAIRSSTCTVAISVRIFAYSTAFSGDDSFTVRLTSFSAHAAADCLTVFIPIHGWFHQEAYVWGPRRALWARR